MLFSFGAACTNIYIRYIYIFYISFQIASGFLLYATYTTILNISSLRDVHSFISCVPIG